MAIKATAVDRSKFRAKCNTDTGFAARYLFEFNYDEEMGLDGVPIRINRPNGGIRRDGPHKEMADFVDLNEPELLILTPRGSYKTSLIKCRIGRSVLCDRDTTILYCMKTEKMAKSKVKDMGRMLLSPKVKENYGNVKGKTWSSTQLFLSGRSHNVDQSSPNIQACGVEQGITGSHYNIIVVDDIVDWDTVKNPDQIEATKDFFTSLIPILAPGGTIIVVGTRYVDSDLYGYIIRELKNFKILRLDCGMKVQRDESGSWSLEGEPTYPHLTEKVLQQKFAQMNNPSDFVSQYMNEIMSSAEQLFVREQFQSIPRWEEWMGQLSGYILTDSATTQNVNSCYSALAFVGLDFRDHAYLLDLRVGRMKPYEFVQNFINLLVVWGPKVFIKGCTFENIALNDTYRAMIVNDCREQGLSPRLIGIPRGGAGADKKDRRIEKLQGRFASGRFHVVGTVPRTFNDLGKTVELWNPEGWMGEETLFPQPSGELVNQFILHPRYGRKDIADCLADIDTMDRIGKRYCNPAPKPSNHVNWGRTKPAPGTGMPIVPATMNINGIERIVNVATGPPGQGESWWDQANDRVSRRGTGSSPF